MPPSSILKQVNDLIDQSVYKIIAFKSVKNALIEAGYLSQIEASDTEKIATYITDIGRELGIYVEHRISSNGKEYDVLMYNANAQKYIVDNLKEMTSAK